MTSVFTQDIGNIPLDIKRENLSLQKFIEGYRAAYEQLSIQELVQYLQNKPELIGYWRSWSENKRCSSGWYFDNNGKNFIVGHYPNGDAYHYSCPAEACANFIIKELGAILR